MAKLKGLGRGLDALLAGGYLSEEEAHEGIQALMATYRERF